MYLDLVTRDFQRLLCIGRCHLAVIKHRRKSFEIRRPLQLGRMISDNDRVVSAVPSPKKSVFENHVVTRRQRGRSATRWGTAILAVVPTTRKKIRSDNAIPAILELLKRDRAVEKNAIDSVMEGFAREIGLGFRPQAVSYALTVMKADEDCGRSHKLAVRKSSQPMRLGRWVGSTILLGSASQSQAAFEITPGERRSR